MTCCNQMISSFNNVASQVIAYGADKQAIYGSRPNVQVYFKDGAEYVLSDDFNNVTFTGSSIEVDFGGISVGIIKIF